MVCPSGENRAPSTAPERNVRRLKAGGALLDDSRPSANAPARARSAAPATAARGALPPARGAATAPAGDDVAALHVDDSDDSLLTDDATLLG